MNVIFSIRVDGVSSQDLSPSAKNSSRVHFVRIYATLKSNCSINAPLSSYSFGNKLYRKFSGTILPLSFAFFSVNRPPPPLKKLLTFHCCSNCNLMVKQTRDEILQNRQMFGYCLELRPQVLKPKVGIEHGCEKA